MWVPINSENHSGSCSENCGFSYCSSREMPFREWNFAFRELVSEFRELLREYPGTLRELREWPFHSESVFPEIGVVPRLLNLIRGKSTPQQTAGQQTVLFVSAQIPGRLGLLGGLGLLEVGFLTPERLGLFEMGFCK